MENDTPDKSTKKTKVKDFETNSTNPYIPHPTEMVKKWKIYAKRKKKRHGGGQFANVDGGEVMEAELFVFGEWLISEREEFSKLYAAGRDAMVGLSQAGVRMLCYLLKSLKKDSDTVYLSVEGFLEYANYKNRKSYYEGAFELLQAGFVARCLRENDYFINPNMIFNGKRHKIKEVGAHLEEMIRLKNSRYEENGH